MGCTFIKQDCGSLIFLFVCVSLLVVECNGQRPASLRNPTNGDPNGDVSSPNANENLKIPPDAPISNLPPKRRFPPPESNPTSLKDKLDDVVIEDNKQPKEIDPIVPEETQKQKPEALETSENDLTPEIPAEVKDKIPPESETVQPGENDDFTPSDNTVNPEMDNLNEESPEKPPVQIPDPPLDPTDQISDNNFGENMDSEPNSEVQTKKDNDGLEKNNPNNVKRDADSSDLEETEDPVPTDGGDGVGTDDNNSTEQDANQINENDKVTEDEETLGDNDEITEKPAEVLPKKLELTDGDVETEDSDYKDTDGTEETKNPDPESKSEDLGSEEDDAESIYDDVTEDPSDDLDTENVTEQDVNQTNVTNGEDGGILLNTTDVTNVNTTMNGTGEIDFSPGNPEPDGWWTENSRTGACIIIFGVVIMGVMTACVQRKGYCKCFSDYEDVETRGLAATGRPDYQHNNGNPNFYKNDAYDPL
uniref:uncharacterized SDCCAG3 family protein-like isoform X2 n=1 Tax=Ciona intestinalis TaxID=7719 RepID=UPI000EF4C065|nr:uncharacterized SDCCAG3 family protein-like isoform X2 [Ciona intestinalis]|eukprot:XP_026693557.1 uncharacterized SDCCAG3 family protein-like isoform X2 [Ciona intestinalis]